MLQSTELSNLIEAWLTNALVEDVGVITGGCVKVGHQWSDVLSGCQPLVQEGTHVDETCTQTHTHTLPCTVTGNTHTHLALPLATHTHTHLAPSLATPTHLTSFVTSHTYVHSPCTVTGNTYTHPHPHTHLTLFVTDHTHTHMHPPHPPPPHTHTAPHPYTEAGLPAQSLHLFTDVSEASCLQARQLKSRSPVANPYTNTKPIYACQHDTSTV